MLYRQPFILPHRIGIRLIRGRPPFCYYSNAAPSPSESEPSLAASPEPEADPNPTFSLPTPPPPSQTNHSSLSTFLDYARRTSLSPTSTTYVGTHYEYTVADTLLRLRLNLHRVGGRSDSGIDLLGTWHLPTFRNARRVIVQCKALKAKLGPNLIRELEGAFVGAPAGWRGEGVLGVLVSKREATKGVREAMGRSRWPLVWMGVESEVPEGYEVGTAVVKQVLWNQRAREVGLEGINVTTRYEADGVQKELVLMWKGTVLEGIKRGDYVRGVEGDEAGQDNTIDW